MDAQLEGQVRSALIAIFSIVGTIGIFKGLDAVTLTSVVVTLINFVWSWQSNRAKRLVEQAAKSPDVLEIKLADPKVADSIPSDKVVGPA